jgi:microsomal dipeptidase-like Zn-dependent dipeptidase
MKRIKKITQLRIFTPSERELTQEFFNDYQEIVGDITNLQPIQSSQELGKKIQELGKKIQELGKKCCQGNFFRVLDDPVA